MQRRDFLRTAAAAVASQTFGTSSVRAAASDDRHPGEMLSDPTLGVSRPDPDRASSVSLAGTWKFALDPASLGVSQQWFNRELGPETIFLPGSTDQAGYGDKTAGPADGHLSRPFEYTGPAWYQQTVTVPDVWRGYRLAVSLERCHWQTSLWVDGKPFGTRNSLSVPHVYELGATLEPGAHTLTLCVDNTIRIDIGATAHAITEQTQTDWNGVIGKMELRCTPPTWIERVDVYPDPANKQAQLKVLVRNITSSTGSGCVRASLNGSENHVEVAVPSFAEEETIALTLPVPQPMQFWDDVKPSLYEANLRLSITIADGQVLKHEAVIRFGMRQLSAKNCQFVLNGRPVFLRGTVENAVFPFTAYPEMQIEAWHRIFRIVRSYGMNHLRFHSWCPPECAFVAADEAGILLHVELPVFSHHVGTTPGLEEFMRQEAHRILETYGNHPSFAFLCMGNELKGDFAFLDQLVGELKQADPRRLYTYSTNNGREAPGKTSDYWVTEETKEGRLRIDRTRFGAKPGGTNYDFSAAIAGLRVPVVAHELGQWAVYPSYSEIDSYTGVLKPRNLEVFRTQLEAHGMGDQADIFQAASGCFAAKIYKEDIESAIRTPNLGGFQLLELTDYPGQHEALVGVLDCFWDSKGVITADAFRCFCANSVPLARFEKFVWLSDETFRARAEVAYYGKEEIRRPVVEWSVRDDSGRILRTGRMHRDAMAPGGVTSFGDLEYPLALISSATRLTLSLRLNPGEEVINHWHVWVYPSELALPRSAAVKMASELDEGTIEGLQQGDTVFLHAAPQSGTRNLLKLRFLPVFWSFAMFRKQPGVLGILCDPRHPAFADFPTEFHSDWQWWEVTEGTNAFILNDAPLSLRPLLQVIDDFHRNDRLGMVIEAKVGKGKLLATSLPLPDETRPVTRQLFYSLLRYASGSSFQPRSTLNVDTLRRLLT